MLDQNQTPPSNTVIVHFDLAAALLSFSNSRHSLRGNGTCHNEPDDLARRGALARKAAQGLPAADYGVGEKG